MKAKGPCCLQWVPSSLAIWSTLKGHSRSDTTDCVYDKSDGFPLWQTQVLLMSYTVEIPVTKLSLFAPSRKWSINQVWWYKLVIPIPKAKAGWLWFWGQLGICEEFKASLNYIAMSSKEKKRKKFSIKGGSLSQWGVCLASLKICFPSLEPSTNKEENIQMFFTVLGRQRILEVHWWASLS